MSSPDSSPVSVKRDLIERELMSRNMEALLNTAATLQVRVDELEAKLVQLENLRAPKPEVNGHDLPMPAARN